MSDTSLGARLVRKWSWLDPVANVFGAIVGGFYRIPGTKWIKSILHGTWVLRHPLHPAITDLTVGAYTVLAVMNVLYLAQRDPAFLQVGTTVLIVALLSSLVSMLSGLTDWNDTFGNERRLGILHGVLMTLISVAFAVSLWMRTAQGPSETALYIELGAFLALIVAAHLGGEMVFGFGTGVNRLAWTHVPDKWQTLDVRADALEDRKPVLIKVKGINVMVLKLDGDLVAMTSTCTHAGGPLHEGKFVGNDRRNVECPWHFSVFSVPTGHVLLGPATVDEVSFETRVASDGRVEVRSKEA